MADRPKRGMQSFLQRKGHDHQTAQVDATDLKYSVHDIPPAEEGQRRGDDHQMQDYQMSKGNINDRVQFRKTDASSLDDMSSAEAPRVKNEAQPDEEDQDTEHHDDSSHYGQDRNAEQWEQHIHDPDFQPHPEYVKYLKALGDVEIIPTEYQWRIMLDSKMLPEPGRWNGNSIVANQMPASAYPSTTSGRPSPPPPHDVQPAAMHRQPNVRSQPQGMQQVESRAQARTTADTARNVYINQNKRQHASAPAIGPEPGRKVQFHRTKAGEHQPRKEDAQMDYPRKKEQPRPMLVQHPPSDEVRPVNVPMRGHPAHQKDPPPPVTHPTTTNLSFEDNRQRTKTEQNPPHQSKLLRHESPSSPMATNDDPFDDYHHSDTLKAQEIDDDEMILDHDPEILRQMQYADLKNGSFDIDPHDRPFSLPQAAREGTLEQKLAIVAKMPVKEQMHYFSTLSINEWEQAGDWFLGRFAGLLEQLKTLRRDRRIAGQEFEKQVEMRFNTVKAKREQTEAELSAMKESGGKVLQGTPKRPNPR